MFGRYRWDLEHYNTYKHWDKNVIRVLKVIFPNGLTDKEIDTAGMLPLSLNGRLALDHIEGKTKTDIVATGAYCDILVRMMMRQYVPNGDGSVQFLKDMRHDQIGANALADDCAISDGQLIKISKQAFLKSGHVTADVPDINVKWSSEPKRETRQPRYQQITRSNGWKISVCITTEN